MKHTRFAIAASVLAITVTAQSGVACARDQINIVGSSTLFPFAVAVAEKFGESTDFKTPKIESTGSGGGLKLFCSGVGLGTPDITNASRRIKAKELKKCNESGVKDIVEFKVGFDGIVIANAKSGPTFSFTRAQLFKALVKGSKAKTWSDIDAALPNEKIEVLGPPPTSGTRDAFEELVMQKGCVQAGGDKKTCRTVEVRSDGVWIDSGENDNLIVTKLQQNRHAVGVFGFSFLEQNKSQIKGSKVDGVPPTFDNIAEGTYPVSRSLYFYVKKAHIGKVPGMQEYLGAWAKDEATGEEGYLADKGLIPLTEEERTGLVARAKNLTVMTGQEKLH